MIVCIGDERTCSIEIRSYPGRRYDEIQVISKLMFDIHVLID